MWSRLLHWMTPEEKAKLEEPKDYVILLVTVLFTVVFVNICFDEPELIHFLLPSIILYILLRIVQSIR